MRKFIHIIAIIVALMGFTTANATELKEGENTFDGHKAASASYTAEKDCKLLIECQETWSVKHGDIDVSYQYVPASGYSYSYEIEDVKKGETITISSDFIWNSISKVRLTVFENGSVLPVEILAYTPQLNKTFAWTTTGLVTINFNKAVTMNSVELVAGTKVYTVEDINAGTSVGFNIQHALNAALRAGDVKRGEKFHIVIKGLRDAQNKDNLYNGNGMLDMVYVAPYPQYDLLKAEVNGGNLTNDYTLLSYYAPDSEDGVMTFYFEEKIKQISDAYLTMGVLDMDSQGKYYRGKVNYTIEDNKLTIDLRGTLRTLRTLFPTLTEESEDDGSEEMFGTFDTSHITLVISNVMDINGNPFMSPGSGTVGSYAYVMNYKELIDEAYIDGEGIAEGDEVEGGQQITLWLSNPDIKFEGLRADYLTLVSNPNDEAEPILEPRNTIIKDFTIEPDPLEGVFVTFNLPALADAAPGEKITISLNEASSSDGMPHDLYIIFVIKDIENGIASVTEKKNANGTYTMGGVKVEQMTKGKVYVTNGKKVMR